MSLTTMKDADHSGGKKEPLGMITSAQVVDLPDSMGDRIPENDDDSSSSSGNTSPLDSSASTEMVCSSVTTSDIKSSPKGLTGAGRSTEGIMSSGISTSRVTPSPAAQVEPTTSPLPGYLSSTPPQGDAESVSSGGGDLHPGAINSKREDGGEYFGCHGHGYQRLSSLWQLQPLTEPRGHYQNNLDNLPLSLSSCVKLMNLDIPASSIPAPLPPSYYNHSNTTTTMAGTRSATPNHSISLLNSNLSNRMMAAAPPPSTGHLAGNRGAVLPPSTAEYHTPPSRGTGMSQAFLFPHSNPSGGLFALHDPRSSLPPGLGDFSPSLVGDINTVSSIGGAASLNNMFSPVTSGATTPGRLPTGLPPTSGPKLGKRQHDLGKRSHDADQDFSANTIRDIAFPPDSGPNISSWEKGDDLGLKNHTLGGVMTEQGSNSGGTVASQHLKWRAHMVKTWMDLCDAALLDISSIGFQVETDKGFTFSVADDCFVCQKKNHFQVTVTIVFSSLPKFVKMKNSGLIKPIENFSIHLHGVKFEQVNCEIKLERSKADRTKTKFEPEIIDLPTRHDEPIKQTLCRLHFSETTQNNQRKRRKPNPDQKYFSLVVALHAETADGSYPVVAHVSERIVVRASNPGNFDNDCDSIWMKSQNSEHIHYHGRVGINTERPEEALTVNGNIQLTGQILQASDIRIKRDIEMMPSLRHFHLDNISCLQLYKYRLKGSDIGTVSCSDCHHQGVLPNVNSNDSNHDVPSHGTTNDIEDNDRRHDDVLSHGNHRKAAINGIEDSDHRHADIENRPFHNYSTSSPDESSYMEESRGRESVTNSLLNPSQQETHTSHQNTQQTSVTMVNAADDSVTEDGVSMKSKKMVLGLLAQEVMDVLPNAVIETEQEVRLLGGERVKNLLVVDKDQVLMETLGAVQELKRITDRNNERLNTCEENQRRWTGSCARRVKMSMDIKKGRKEDFKIGQDLPITIGLQIHTTLYQCIILIVIATIIFTSIILL